MVEVVYELHGDDRTEEDRVGDGGRSKGFGQVGEIDAELDEPLSCILSVTLTETNSGLAGRKGGLSYQEEQSWERSQNSQNKNGWQDPARVLGYILELVLFLGLLSIPQGGGHNWSLGVCFLLELNVEGVGD